MARRAPLTEDPSRFYTGIVAELYGALKSVTQDPEPYAQFIAAAGEPALELGCGDGHPLLELRQRGLDVDGVDSSADMLERCRRTAAELGLTVAVHEQKIEALDLSRRYRSIFLAGPTFNLLPDDDAASRALASIRAHLADGGSALVPLFVPTPTELGQVREATAADGALLRFSSVGEVRDDAARTQETMQRYERITDGGATVVERPWILHWYTQAGFDALATAAGLRTAAILDADGRPATADADVFVFWLHAAESAQLGSA